MNHKAIETLAGSRKSKGPAGCLGKSGVPSFSAFLSPFNTQNPYKRGTGRFCSRKSCQPGREEATASPGAASCLMQIREGESSAGKCSCSPLLSSFALTQCDSIAVKVEEAPCPAVPVP